MIRFLKSTSITCAFLIAVSFGASQTLSAVNIEFDTAGSYDNNFWESGSGDHSAFLTWNSGGYVAMIRLNDKPTQASSAVYNSAVTGGIGGNGGAALGSPLNQFSNYRLEADISFSNLASGSFGFLTGLNNAGIDGSLIVFRLDNSRDVRLFEGASSVTSAAGTSTDSAGISSGTTFSADTQYTFRLDVETDGNSIIYTTSILDLDGNFLADSIVFTDNNPIRTEGQVGFRLGVGASGNETRLHRYSVTAIPEPSTYALMGGVLALGLAIAARRRKQ